MVVDADRAGRLRESREDPAANGIVVVPGADRLGFGRARLRLHREMDEEVPALLPRQRDGAATRRARSESPRRRTGRPSGREFPARARRSRRRRRRSRRLLPAGGRRARNRTGAPAPAALPRKGSGAARSSTGAGREPDAGGSPRRAQPRTKSVATTPRATPKKTRRTPRRPPRVRVFWRVTRPLWPGSRTPTGP